MRLEVVGWLRRPYSHLASSYDRALGVPFLFRTRRAFEHLVQRYGLRFRSAADLGCGTGLFACYLNRRWGVPVFAVDRSPEMLRVALENCRVPRVCFLRQDIRELCLPSPVDLITANFDALNHVLSSRDLQDVFRRIRENLRPGGHLLFDIITPCQPWARYVRRLPTTHGELVQRVRWHRGRRLLTVLMVHRRPFSTTVELHAERAYSPLDVGRWLQGTGFEVRGIHDAESLALASTCPSRAIMVARASMS